jgi:hypothetical protein
VALSALAGRVASAVREHFPSTRCFLCLSLQLASTEKEVRDAAQVLVVRDEFKTVSRVCVSCSGVDGVLMPPKGA